MSTWYKLSEKTPDIDPSRNCSVPVLVSYHKSIKNVDGSSAWRLEVVVACLSNKEENPQWIGVDSGCTLYKTVFGIHTFWSPLPQLDNFPEEIRLVHGERETITICGNLILV
jgi:hypothetical protein